ncbi:chromosome segregation protein SMC [Atopococcus tabaci]|uniref:chromosome segregation protein SMC n=1 Tax=Atopococcus tabaci TaxID=269774 RepID=UPI00040A2F80|nr:chromosome segregation protein SMC [Atopococcus tabaci]
MQLKKIEIQGFKSFADKTTIEFNEGITAIVGPNGSGKSNIIEAIRWVMGEQSARNLRGGKMPDVIFSGSDNRKAVNIAEVTLTLNNQDQFLPVEFEEVAITRRLHRNGTSEYFINKQPCRLKDIVDLFMDSGLGRESFSIISQGQVEAVFNSKPEDRRAIFEEAAGVLKYKNRKKKAEQKLEETKENLDRVQDILYELEHQLEPLERESSIAKAYLDQKNELTQLDIAVTSKEIHELHQEIQQKNTQIKQYTSKLQKINEELQVQTVTVSQHKKQSKLIQEEQDALHRKLLSVVQAYERAEAESKLADERNRHSAEQTERIEQTLQKLKQEKQELQSQLDRLTVELKSHQDDQRKVSDKLAILENQRKRLEGNKEAVIEELREQYIDGMQQQSAFNNERTYLEKNLQQQQARKKKIDDQINEAENSYQQCTSDLEGKTLQLKQLKKEIKELLERYGLLQEEYKEAKKQFETGEYQIQEAVRILQEAKAKRTSLKELQDNYSGYFQGVRAVMKRTNQLHGIVGTVAELMEVPKQFQTALDTALGTSSQFVVVDDEEAGRKAIEFLKKNKSGRATFLPLTTLRPRKIPEASLEQVKSQRGFLGVASDLITFDKKVSGVMGNLLGNTLVAEDLPSAVNIAKLVNHRYRIVSLDGDVMNAGGSMTGGARKKSSSINLFSQKNELAQLNTQIKKMEQTLEDKETELGNLKRTCGKQALELEELKEAGEQKRWQERQLTSEIESLEEKKNQLEKQLTASRYELADATQEIESDTARMTKVSEQAEKVRHQIDSLKQEMETVTAKWEDREKEKERIDQEMRTLQAALSSIKEEAAGTRKELAVLKKQHERVTTEIDDASRTLQVASSPAPVKTKEETQAELAQLTKEKEQLEAKQEELKVEKDKVERQLEQAEAALTQQQNTKQSLQTLQSTSEVEVNRKEVQLDHLLDYLREEYAISFEEARNQEPLGIPFDEAKKKVQLLKKGIEELGHVNLGAIEDYEKVSSRWEFLTKQQTDLLEAKDSLHETMNDMDQEVSRRFKETFDLIKERFSVVFPKMFGGGKAELILTDPDDLLHSGVDIVAQPPGKKLQHLSLLSGGERALTAISLLFSIIQVRPIPFCILDEAEAALDEANVIRFGRYLHTFEEDIQFIVITHRKGTMEEADTLYGVTMQERGVSHLVSVRLTDMEEKVGVH